MDFERGIVWRSHLGAISSECEVMFVFLSCPDSRGVDRTLCLHLRCPPFSCLWGCIMKSLFTLWNLKRYKVAPSSFMVLFLPAERQNKEWITFFFFIVLLTVILSSLSFEFPSQPQESDSFHTNREMLWFFSRLLAHLDSLAIFPVQEQSRVLSLSMNVRSFKSWKLHMSFCHFT